MIGNRAIMLTVFVAAVEACSSSSAPSRPAVSDPSQTPTFGAQTEIAVTLTDALKVSPEAMAVPVGLPVTFVVTNNGSIEHEFYIGDEAAQTQHESEMQMGGMMHDDPNGISLQPGETKQLTTTFAAAGETLAGCHVAGHYAAGMRATITIV